MINTLEAQDHICKKPKEGLPKRTSVASLFGDSLTVGTGEMASRSGKSLITRSLLSYVFVDLAFG